MNTRMLCLVMIATMGVTLSLMPAVLAGPDLTDCDDPGKIYTGCRYCYKTLDGNCVEWRDSCPLGTCLTK